MFYYIIGIILFIIIVLLIQKVIKLNAKLEAKNEELKSLKRKVNKQSQLSRDFISSLSKELRTPLYGIMGLTSILTNDHPELADNKNLKSLKFSSNYLLTLINNILQVNFIDSGKITPQPKVFNLKDLSQSIINSFSYATKNSNTIIHFGFDPEIDRMVFGDSGLLSQILINLISNALRFNKKGNVYFSVNLIKIKKDSYNISFKIKYDGDEVSKEDQQSIYKEFLNLENMKRKYLDTGLNATIIGILAKSLKGEILHNNSENGSEYVFVADIGMAPINGKQLEVNEGIKKKALIVDDNKLNLLVADKILSKENFKCTTIDNGFDAINLAKENSYDIILMDINMPKLNGIGTTKRIREFDPKTPIIALTAVDVTQLNRQIIMAGLNDYILKPYDRNLLLEMINKHITTS